MAPYAASYQPDNRPSRWFVVHAKARQERRTCERLTEEHITTFLPQLLLRHTHGSRRWEAVEPLFPGYFFAHFTPHAALIHHVRWTPGVRRLLGDEVPIAVPGDVVECLRERVGAKGYIVPRQWWMPGIRVRLTGGPFDLLEGIIERPTSRADRVRVLLALCATTVAVEVAADEIEPV
jgi:transcriptional antiterminator RfaH